MPRRALCVAPWLCVAFVWTTGGPYQCLGPARRAALSLGKGPRRLLLAPAPYRDGPQILAGEPLARGCHRDAQPFFFFFTKAATL